MLVAVTNRADLSRVLAQAASAVQFHGTRAVRYESVEDIGDVMDVAAEVSVLVVDLGYCGLQTDLITHLAIWRTLNPACAIVLVRLMPDKEAEGTLLMELGQRMPYGRRDIGLREAEAYSVPRWVEILLANPATVVLHQIHQHFEQVLQADLPNRPLLLQMLNSATHGDGTVKEICQRLGNPARADSTHRHSLAGTLYRAGQPSPKEILTGFRVAVHARLLELTRENPQFWTTARRVEVMGAANQRALRKSLARCTGTEYEQLKQLVYDDAVELCADLTYPGEDGPERTVAKLLAPVVARHAKLKRIDDAYLLDAIPRARGA
jgi:hypothetical protein